MLFLIVIAVIGGGVYYFYFKVYPDASLAVFPKEIYNLFEQYNKEKSEKMLKNEG